MWFPVFLPSMEGESSILGLKFWLNQFIQSELFPDRKVILTFLALF